VAAATAGQWAIACGGLAGSVAAFASVSMATDQATRNLRHCVLELLNFLAPVAAWCSFFF